jgi:tetraprenyl-beta-curcumene synthase
LRYPDISQSGSARVPSSPHSSPAGRAALSRLAAFAAASTRELLWGLRAVVSEVARWRGLAAAIPDETLRHDALRAIDRKRANIDGAALFWVLPRHRNPNLLRLLIAYEILADFLDCISEHSAHVGVANGLCLHSALRDALDPAAPISEYYRCHPWTHDGEYLRRLIATCQRMCELLPSFHVTRPFLDHAASLTEVLALNHEPDPSYRDTVLSTWANLQFPGQPELAWFEWCGGASAWLTILALLALATDPARGTAEAKGVYDAYLPWVSLAGTMLDSYVDMAEDTTENAHSYIAHYPDQKLATERVIEIVTRSLREVNGLPSGHRHLVIVRCMVAMYLSKDSARTSAMRADTDTIIRANGNLGYVLVLVLRAWRILYRQQAA